MSSSQSVAYVIAYNECSYFDEHGEPKQFGSGRQQIQSEPAYVVADSEQAAHAFLAKIQQASDNPARLKVASAVRSIRPTEKCSHTLRYVPAVVTLSLQEYAR